LSLFQATYCHFRPNYSLSSPLNFTNCKKDYIFGRIRTLYQQIEGDTCTPTMDNSQSRGTGQEQQQQQPPQQQQATIPAQTQQAPPQAAQQASTHMSARRLQHTLSISPIRDTIFGALAPYEARRLTRAANVQHNNGAGMASLRPT
jgi:hypothetical protein